MSKKIFGIGTSGLVGSRIVQLLPQFSFTQLGTSNGIDITQPETLDIISKDTEHDIVLHLAAKADVDGCERDKPLGKEGDAYKINVLGTEHVVEACKKGNKKIIYISTDFVFDGEHTPESGYREDDPCNPVNWYAQTKFDGEMVVKNSGVPFIIARIAYPYQKETFEKKKDFLHAIHDRLRDGLPIKGVTDHIMTPTCIDDIAYALQKLIENNVTGLYHIVGSQGISPYDAALLIAEIFNFDKNLISKTTRAEYFEGKAPRPFNLFINNDRIEQLGVRMRGFEEALRA